MRLSKPAGYVLAAILVAIGIIQPFVDLTQSEHTAISLITVSLAAVGVVPSLASGIAKVLPVPVVHVLGLAAGALTAIVQNVDGLPDVWKAVIGGVSTFLLAIGVVPVAVNAGVLSGDEAATGDARRSSRARPA